MYRQLISQGKTVATVGPELPPPGPNLRAWPLQPQRAFGRVRTIVDAMSDLRQTARVRAPVEIAALQTREERAEAMRAWRRANPNAQRQHDLHIQFAELGLALLDERGQALAAWSFVVTAVPLSHVVGLPRAVLGDFRASGFVGEPPFYMLVATLREPALLARARAYASRPSA